MNENMSICLFGSVARREADEISDKDILVVYEKNKPSVEDMKRVFGSKCEFSFYERSKLEFLALSGSLFIAHLKYEGIILRDDNNWLHECLDRFVPKKAGHYEMEAHHAIGLVDVLERFEARGSVENFSLIADIAYISFRNVMIFEAASKGRYIFAYHDLVKFCLEARNVSSEPDFFVKLRRGRHSYQIGNYDSDVRMTVSEIYEVFSDLDFEVQHREISTAFPLRVDRDRFFAIRDFEAIVSRRLGYRPKNIKPNNQLLFDAWEFVNNSKGYNHLADKEVFSVLERACQSLETSAI